MKTAHYPYPKVVLDYTQACDDFVYFFDFTFWINCLPLLIPSYAWTSDTLHNSDRVEKKLWLKTRVASSTSNLVSSDDVCESLRAIDQQNDVKIY